MTQPFNSLNFPFCGTKIEHQQIAIEPVVFEENNFKKGNEKILEIQTIN